MLSFYKTLNYQRIDMTSFLNLSLEKKILKMKIKKNLKVIGMKLIQH